MYRPNLLRRPALLALATMILAGLGAGAPGVATPARAASAILPGIANRTSLDVEARYDVRVKLRLASGTLSVAERIEITNRSGGPIDHLELNTVLVRIGALRITSATIDGRPVRPTVADQTVRFPLGGFLPDGATASLRLTFSARFGTSAFFRAMRTYLGEHRNGIGSTRELLAAFDAADPNDLARLLRPRFPRIL